MGGLLLKEKENWSGDNMENSRNAAPFKLYFNVKQVKNAIWISNFMNPHGGRFLLTGQRHIIYQYYIMHLNARCRELVDQLLQDSVRRSIQPSIKQA